MLPPSTWFSRVKTGFSCEENDWDPDLGKATLVPLKTGGKAPTDAWMHQMVYVLTTAYHRWELSSSGTSIARRRPVSTWISARLKCKISKWMKQRNTLPISTRPHCLKVVSGCFEQKQERSTKSTKTEANKEAWVIWAEAKRTIPGSGLTCSLWSLVNFDRFVGSLYNFESWTWLSPNICVQIECKNSEVQRHIQALY